MTTKKVWVIVSESVYDSDSTLSVEVYSTLEKAKAGFDKIVAEEKASDHLYDTGDFVVEESETEFCIYADGAYSEDHFSVSILEKEIQ